MKLTKMEIFQKHYDQLNDEINTLSREVHIKGSKHHGHFNKLDEKIRRRTMIAEDYFARFQTKIK